MSSPSTTSAGPAAMDQRGQGRDPMDAAVMPLIRRQRRPPSASRPCIQSRQLPAYARDARVDQGLVADEPTGKADQDRREGREPRPLRRLPDGRGRRSETSVRRHPSAHRGTAAAAGHVNSVTKFSLSRVPRKTTGDLRLDERKIDIPGRATASRPAPERIYKPRRGLNDISVFSKSRYGPSLSRNRAVNLANAG